MTIEELVRAELRSVAEQVAVPSLPSLEEPRRSWRVVVVAAAAAVVLVIGGLTFLLRDDADPPVRPVEKPKVDHVDRSAPTIPWIDGDRLFVGGRRIPGRWLEVYSAGHTWLARRADGRVFWGRGLQRHSLGMSQFPLAYDGPYLSPGGRYVAGGIGNTLGGHGDRQHDDCAADRLCGGRGMDRGSHRRRSHPLHPGGRDRGSGVLRPPCWPAAPASEDPGRASDTDHDLRAAAERRARRRLGRRRRRNPGAPGRSGERWVTPRRVSEFAASLSTDRQWLLDLGWTEDRDEPETLPVTAVDDGRPAPVSAPPGWVFAPQLAPGFWEPEGTLVTFVVRPESREYRTVRCAPVSGACVLLEES